MRRMILVIITAALAGCGPTSLQQSGTTPFSGSRLADTLSGRGVGLPMTCLPAGRRWTSHSLDDGGIAYRSGRQTFVGTLQGGSDCSKVGRVGYTLVTRARGGGMCAGDIAQVMDTSTRMIVAHCVYGPFIPYELGHKWR